MDLRTYSAETIELLRELLFSSYKSGLLQKIDEEGLTFLHRSILLYIMKHNGCKMKDVCDGLAISPPALTRMVDKLVKLKYIKRETKDEERRALFMDITDKGRKLVEENEERSIKVIEGMLSKVTDKKELECIKLGLETLIRIMKQ